MRAAFQSKQARRKVDNRERGSIRCRSKRYLQNIAEVFHHYYHVLGPDFGCENKSNGETWEQASQQEKSRLVAAARLALLELATTAGEREDPMRYFAKPGEAEWGC
jgi:hypothetical protein